MKSINLLIYSKHVLSISVESTMIMLWVEMNKILFRAATFVFSDSNVTEK